jgi:hypothetical protein
MDCVVDVGYFLALLVVGVYLAPCGYYPSQVPLYIVINYSLTLEVWYALEVHNVYEVAILYLYFASEVVTIRVLGCSV